MGVVSREQRTWQEKERARKKAEKDWARRRDAVVAVVETFGAAIGPQMEAIRRIARSPVWLDLRMAAGGYEEDLAESHGEVEDVWV